MKILISILILLAAAPALTQPAPPERTAQDQRPKHLVVFNKPGPNFGKLAVMRPQALAHRDIYRRLTANGDIVASGALEGEPVLGLTVFRQGIDEAAVRRLLTDDEIVKAGVLEVEFRRWSIQMGALNPASVTSN